MIGELTQSCCKRFGIKELFGAIDVTCLWLSCIKPEFTTITTIHNSLSSTHQAVVKRTHTCISLTHTNSSLTVPQRLAYCHRGVFLTCFDSSCSWHLGRHLCKRDIPMGFCDIKLLQMHMSIQEIIGYYLFEYHACTLN